MSWTTTEDLDEFLTVAGDSLRAEAVRNTLILTVTDSLTFRGTAAYGDEPPFFGWWREGGGNGGGEGAITAAFLQTPPYPVLLTHASAQAAAALADTWKAAARPLSGVTSDTTTAAALVTAWQALTGDRAETATRIRLYRLGELTPPHPLPPGRARTADGGDRDLLLEWVGAFAKDIGDPPTDPAPLVDDRISHGGYTLWEVDGEPVSVAAITRQVAGTVRVNTVYTPPRLRGRGYASAAAAAASRAALDAGADHVLLFTDLDNPTSNGIYRRLGYLPVEDRVELSFMPAP